MGRVEDFYVNPNNKQQIYSCSRSGGLWKTENEGATWYSLSTETLVASGVNSIAVNPSDFNQELDGAELRKLSDLLYSCKRDLEAS